MLLQCLPDSCDEAFAAPVAGHRERGEGAWPVKVYSRVFPDDDLHGSSFDDNTLDKDHQSVVLIIKTTD